MTTTGTTNIKPRCNTLAADTKVVDGPASVAAVELDVGMGSDSRRLLGSTRGASPIVPNSPVADVPLKET